MDLTMIHPMTGLHAIGIVGGRPVWPVMGGAPDEPASGQQTGQHDAQQAAQQAQGDGRPEGLSDDEWAALGDPGKRAIERERRAARDERRQREQLERDLAEARRGPTQQPENGQQAPKGEPAGKGKDDGAPDFAALIRQAVSEAVAPFQERDAQRSAERIRDRAQSLAASVLHNPADAANFLDLGRMVTATGDPDEQAIRDGLAQLIEDRPYLARPQEGRRAAPGSGQGAGQPGGTTLQQRVQQQLDLMKTT